MTGVFGRFLTENWGIATCGLFVYLFSRAVVLIAYELISHLSMLYNESYLLSKVIESQMLTRAISL